MKRAHNERYSALISEIERRKRGLEELKEMLEAEGGVEEQETSTAHMSECGERESYFH
jgi:hypothetical protein